MSGQRSDEWGKTRKGEIAHFKGGRKKMEKLNGDTRCREIWVGKAINVYQ